MAGDGLAEKLERLQRAMVKALRRGEQGQFEALAAAYARVRAQQVEALEAEQRTAALERRAAVRPVEESRRWRLPRGFGVSPLAREKALHPPAVEAPQIPVGGLRPWRGGWHPASERVWTPGRRRS